MKKYILSLLLLLSILVQGQNALKKAENCFADFDYTNAVLHYDKAVKNKTELSQKNIEHYADALFYLNDYQNAKEWYSKLHEIKQNEISELTFSRYYTCLRSNKDYDLSLKLIKDYYKNNSPKLNYYASRKKIFDSIANLSEKTKINNLTVNTKYSEFGPVKHQGSIVFSSTRDSSTFKNNLYKWNQQPYLDLYKAEVNLTTGELSQTQLLFAKANKGYHTGTVSFTPDNKYVFFTRNYIKSNNHLSLNKQGLSNLQIVRGTLEDGKIVNEAILKFNSDNYSCGHPAVSDDGKYLFFISDMPGSFGQTDIYVAELFEDGTINTPINLGDQINTVGREMFPYYKNGMLYFASDNHYGFGGLDIYKSAMNSKTSFGTPINLGGLINSNTDDFGLLYNDDLSSGYFSSNRTGGKGDDDIYYFESEQAAKNQTLEGIVYEEVSKLPVGEASIKVLNLFDEVLIETKTDPNGNYSLTLPCSNEYVVVYTKKGYSTKRVNMNIDNIPNKVNKKDVYLAKFTDLTKKEDGKIKIIVNPIYFDYNRSEITPKAEEELAKVLKVMTEFPDISIKIESHTDSRGKDAYNLQLSDKRAKATQAYLIEKGIESSRIVSATGYGESQLKNQCANGVKCSEEEHAVNRRSDFIIINK